MHDDNGIRVGTDVHVLVQFVVGNQAPDLRRTVTCTAKLNSLDPFEPDLLDDDVYPEDGQKLLSLTSDQLTEPGLLRVEFTIPDAEGLPHVNPNERVLIIPVRDTFEDVGE